MKTIVVKAVFLSIKSKTQKLLDRGAFHIVAGNFLTKFTSFFGSVAVVRLLTKTDYGVLSYYENFVSYFMVVSGVGLASGLLRHMVLVDDIMSKKACIVHALKRGNIWNLFIVIVCIIVCLLYPHPEAFQNYKVISVFLALCIPCAFCFSVVLSSLRSMFDNKNYAYLACASSVSLIIMRVFGAVVGGVYMIVVFRLMTELTCMIVGLYILNKKYFMSVVSSRLATDFQNNFDAYSVQMMFTDGLWTIFMLNNVFLLGQLCGSETLIADYKIACVIPSNLAIFVSAVGVFVAPYFTKHESAGDYVWVRKNMFYVVTVTSAIMGCLGVFFFCTARPLIRLLYGEKYLSAVPIMRVLLLTTFFNNGVCSSVANAFSAMGVQKLNLYVAVLGMVIQIVMAIWLIPIYGAIGVAWSGCIVYVMMSVVLLMIFYKKYCHNLI